MRPDMAEVVPVRRNHGKPHPARRHRSPALAGDPFPATSPGARLVTRGAVTRQIRHVLRRSSR
jgi:hypothetical protein